MIYSSNYLFAKINLRIIARASYRMENFARITLNLLSQVLRSVAVDRGDQTVNP